jgi:hypothetical protein
VNISYCIEMQFFHKQIELNMDSFGFHKNSSKHIKKMTGNLILVV